MARRWLARTLAAGCALVIAVAALGSAGCRKGGDAAPACGAVAAHFMYLAEEDLAQASVDDATKRAVRAQLPAMRDALATACTDSHWTEEVRRCLHAARDHAAFEACQQQLTEPQRRALDRSARGETDSP
jgi:methylthioribose-1-phosphate isomerase